MKRSRRKSKKNDEPFDQIKYQNEYIKANYDKISIVCPKGEKAIIKEAARKAGTSMTEYILDAVHRRMDNERENNHKKESF